MSKRTTSSAHAENPKKAKTQKEISVKLTKKEGNPIEDALTSLSSLLREREEALETREEKLKADKEDFERERFAAYGDTSPSDVLHLNVCGKTAAILRRTLTSVPDSMLSSRFSGRWDDSLEKDKDGNFFIDQPCRFFEPMLDYLRDRANVVEARPYPLESPSFSESVDVHRFYRMVEYYGMTNGIFPTNLKVHFGPAEDVERLSPWMVNSPEWVTFKLMAEGHSRGIKSYEVRLGSAQRIQMGWGRDGTKFSSGNSLGVGDMLNSSAIDLSRSCYLNEGSMTSIQGLELKEGTTVRSEDYGKSWYVNGKLVASSLGTREVGVVKSHQKSVGWYPFISVKGEVEITSIEFVTPT